MTVDTTPASEPEPETDRTPLPHKARFVCPICEAFAAQYTTFPLNLGYVQGQSRQQEQLPNWCATICESCHQPTFWNGTSMVWPNQPFGPLAPADLSDGLRPIYDEARAVGNASPRSAAALLRLTLEQLVNDLESGSGNLNSKVGALVKRGLAPQVQQAMDALRVFGNNGAHVGEIDLTDDRETVLALFQVLHLVVDHVVTRQKQVDALYVRIPAGAREAIERRDSSR